LGSGKSLHVKIPRFIVFSKLAQLLSYYRSSLEDNDAEEVVILGSDSAAVTVSNLRASE
jgi:hypothetical protein